MKRLIKERKGSVREVKDEKRQRRGGFVTGLKLLWIQTDELSR